MFRLEGSWLSLMATDRTVAEPGSHTISLQHNVPSEAAVHEVFELAMAAGATALKPPQSAPWGGYEADFADPDGHVWGVTYNPLTDLT